MKGTKDQLHAEDMLYDLPEKNWDHAGGITSSIKTERPPHNFDLYEDLCRKSRKLVLHKNKKVNTICDVLKLVFFTKMEEYGSGEAYTYFSDGSYHCSLYNSRSYIDCYRVLISYFPEVSFEDFYNALRARVNENSYYFYFCDEVECYVFFYGVGNCRINIEKAFKEISDELHEKIKSKYIK